MSKAILISLYIIITTVAFAQQKSLDTYFKQVKAGKYPAIPQEVLKSENAKAVLLALPVYLKDTTTLIRSKAYAITRSIGTKSSDNTIRQEAVQYLIEGMKDKHIGNAGSAINYVTSFKQTDFTTIHKDSLRNIFERKPTHLDVLVKLMGFLEMKDKRDAIYALSQQSTLGRKERWSATLALARMGDAVAIDDIMKRVQRMPVADAVVYEVFPDLVYTRTTQAINYLVTALNSDDKNCAAADAEREAKIPCAYRVMEMLAPVLEGYPLAVDESGDVVASDYPAALATAREWCTSQKEFVIKKSEY
jgi:PBS lyase HEAT-like repeat